MRIDVLFTNGRIRTLDPARPTAERMGVFCGRIIGFDSDLDGVQADRTVDLGGRHVLPGFHDAHFHLSLTGARLAALDLRPGKVNSLEELYAAVAAFAEKLPAGAWVRGSGYDQNYLGGRHPTAAGLDAVAGGRPVLLEHVSAHMVVANSAAFALMGDVPDVEGGTVARDADGKPTGLLQERAMTLAYALVRPIPLPDVQRNIALAGEQTARYGLTSITDPGVGDHEMLGNSPADFHSYLEAVERGTLKTRVTLMPFCTTLHPIFKEGEHAEWRGLDLGIRTGLGDDRLRMGPIKIMADGSFIGRSAAMHHCYHGDSHRGVMMFEPAKLKEMIVGAHAAGWSVAAHAIGDAATDHILDAFEAALAKYPRKDTRHRIEHFAYTSPEQVARAKALGVIPVPQGIFISDFGDGMLEAAPLNERGDREVIYRCKSILDAGIVLPGSTDSPVSDGNPLACIHDMVNRHTRSGVVCEPEERVTVQEAVRAYTYGSAYAVHQEKDKGTLERGKLADFVVLSNDLFEIPPETIKDQRVLMTVIGGEVVYEADK